MLVQHRLRHFDCADVTIHEHDRRDTGRLGPWSGHRNRPYIHLAAVMPKDLGWDILAVYGSYRKWRVLEQGCRRRLEPYRPLQQRGRAL
jgi:hypothetical protein